VLDTAVKTTPAAAGASAKSDTTVNVVATRKIPMWGADFTWWYEFFHGDIASTDSTRRTTWLLLDAGLAMRSLRGDFASDDAKAERTRLLQASGTSFVGLDVGMIMLYNGIRSTINYYWMPGCSVRGLCGGQIVASVSLDAALASGLLNRR
jgi:hypothetical protein